MSTAPSDLTPGSSTAASSPAAATPQPPKKKRRWRRVLLWALIVVGVLSVAARITVAVAFPSVLRKVAAAYGLDASYERMELYLLGGDVGLWHLRVAPKEGGEPLLSAEYVRADVSALNLLRGRLVVRRVEADGLDALARREADGSIPILEQFLSAPPAPPSNAPLDVSLDPPLQVDALRLSRVRARWIDKAVQPPVDARVEVTMRLSDLGSQLRPTRFLLDVTSGELVDQFRVEGQGTARRGSNALDATLQVVARGIHPKPATGYLAPLGVRPSADNLSAHSTVTVKLQATPPASQPAAASANRGTSLHGTIGIENAALVADGKAAAELDRVLITAADVNASRASVTSIVIDGVRGNASRSADGGLHVAGFDLVPAPPPATPSTRPAAPTPAPMPAAAPAPAPGAAAFSVALGELLVKNVHLAFADAAVVPPAQLALLVRQMTVKDVSTDPAAAGKPVTIAAAMSAPGLAESIRLDGAARPFAATKTLDAKMAVDGIRPDALRSYLDVLGIESEFKAGTATAELAASVTPTPQSIKADLRLGNIKLTDGGGELLAFDGVRIDGVDLSVDGSAVRARSIEIVGPRTAAKRDAGGTLRAVGLRTQSGIKRSSPAASGAATPAATTTPPATQPSSPSLLLPRVEIAKLTWKGAALKLADDAISPPASVNIEDAGVELADVVIDLRNRPGGPQPAPGKVNGWLKCPGVVDALSVTGTVTPAPGSVTADLNVRGTGLRGRMVAAYLAPVGVEPVLSNGTLQLRTRATLTNRPSGLAAALAVENLRYADGDTELVGLDAMKVDGVELKAGTITVGIVELTKPRARVERDAKGALLAAGVRLPPPTTRPTTRSAPVVPAATSATAPASQPSAGPPIAFALNRLRVSDAQLTAVDRFVQPAANLVARTNVELDQFVFGRDDAPPARLKITSSLVDTVGSFVAAGTVSPSLKKPRLTMELTGSGFKRGAIAVYLPPGLDVALKDGRFRAKLEAGCDEHPKGGRSGLLAVTDVDYRDGESAEPLLHFDSARMVLGRGDLAGGVIAIDEVSLAGLETSARRSADGAIEVMGLRLAPAAPAAVNARPSGASAAANAAPPPATTGPTDIAQMVADRRAKPPLVTLEKLDVNVRRASFVDAMRADAAPAALADVRLRNVRRIEMLGDDATSAPPVELEITGRVQPVVNQFRVAVQAAPFASQPSVQVAVSAQGISGAGITDLLPELRERLDGKPLTDGRFAAQLEAQATRIERRGPAEFVLDKPIELSAAVRRVEFRSGADGPVLVGVDEVRAEPVRFDPHSGSVVVRTLEITKPVGLLRREADGIHALGLVVKETMAPATQPDATGPAAPTTAPAVAAAPAHHPAAPAKPSAEYRIDKLLVSGIDFRLEDKTVDPPLVVPINTLEVEVRDLSNLALVEPRPVRFNVTAGAGKVPLQGGKEHELFSEVAASGSLALYPQPRGWARSSMSGFEMLALRGPAAAQKVNIEGGVFDSNVELRFRDDGGVDTRSRFAFTDLRMSEGENGPVRKVLQLPGPLDAMIVVLQDASGAITVPINVTVKDSTLGSGQIAGAAVTALGSILTTAMASAPLKVTGGVTELVGLDKGVPFIGIGGKKKDAAGGARPLAVNFPAGVADVQRPAEIDAIAARMRRDKTLEITLRGELGAGDIALAAARANPPPEQCVAVANALRQRKLALLADRNALASRARAVLATSPGKEAGGNRNALLAADRELAATEAALDQVYDLLRPGAERQADRRTRAAALHLAEARLEAVKGLLVSAGIPDAEKRIKIVRASFTPGDESSDDSGGVVLAMLLSKKKP